MFLRVLYLPSDTARHSYSGTAGETLGHEDTQHEDDKGSRHDKQMRALQR